MILKSRNMQARIYADYQASTPVDKRVAYNLTTYFADQCANPHADEHACGWDAAEALADAQRRTSSAIGCDPDEVVFTSGATEANNLIIQGLARRAKPGRRRILVSAIEHKSVLDSANAARRWGCEVDRIPVNPEGSIELDCLSDMMGDDVLLVSIMSVNNEIGTRQPLQEIFDLSDRWGALFHADAAQALADHAARISDVSPHGLTFSGHKIYGPQGIGACYIRRDIQQQIEPLFAGGGQQGGLRPGTVPVALCRAFADAIEAMTGADAKVERRRVAALRTRFADRLLGTPGVVLNGPPLDARHPGNCSLRFTGCDAKDLLSRLQPHVAASTGSACQSGITAPSHVLNAIGLTPDEAAASIRFSFGRYSTEEEVDTAAELILEALAEIGFLKRVA